MLRCTSLTKTYRSGDRELTVLNDITFSLEPGGFAAILGPSGSGKTTLLGLLAGLDRPTAGTVHLDGEELGALDEDARARIRGRKIGFVFQSFQLIPTLTARENVQVPLELRGEDAGVRAGELLARVGLADRGDHYPAQLSGGEQQRVCVARALINKPSLILADEPTGNLDAENEDKVLTLLRDLHHEGHTLVTVTHASVVGNLADRRVELHHGRLADLTVPGWEIERRYDEVLVQMWSLIEDGRVPEPERVKIPDVVDNRRTLQGMLESGLIQSPGERLEFTPRGRTQARDLVRRRRLAEVLFSSAMRMPEPEVELAACRMEHVIDPEVTSSICAFLGHPRTCPHGKPIPTGDCCELPIIS